MLAKPSIYDRQNFLYQISPYRNIFLHVRLPALYSLCRYCPGILMDSYIGCMFDPGGGGSAPVKQMALSVHGMGGETGCR